MTGGQTKVMGAGMPDKSDRIYVQVGIMGILAFTVILASACSRTLSNDTTTPPSEHPAAWVAPYVDVSLTPLLPFESVADGAVGQLVLGFVVADPLDPCRPSWGGSYNIAAAAQTLDLDGRIARLRERGGDVAVSFGGAAGDELAVVCTDAERLAAAYQQVIDRYGLRVVDFDVEGSALRDKAANARRAEAINRLQAADSDLQVWVTLPVAPQGLTPEGVAFLDGLLAAGVEPAGVNVMTMNYGGSRAADQTMHEANVAALTATKDQLREAYRRIGREPDDPSLWRMIGATPMIGQNDVAGDMFTPDDARALVSFAHDVGLGRLSFWSANRDRACRAGVDVKRADSSCSGVEQEPWAFSLVFAE